MQWIESLRSANWNQASGLCFCSYVLGCFTAGYYLVRWLSGKDIREIGSGSVGARNVSRVIGKAGFCATVASDFGKGALVVWLARHFTGDDRLVLLAMLAVVIGHIWPVQLRFHGGKGMATSLGSLVVYDFQIALAFGALFLCLAVLFRRTVLPSLIAMACVPVISMLLGHDSTQAVLLSFWAGLVLVAHRKNLMDELLHASARRSESPEPDQPRL